MRVPSQPGTSMYWPIRSLASTRALEADIGQIDVPRRLAQDKRHPDRSHQIRSWAQPVEAKVPRPTSPRPGPHLGDYEGTEQVIQYFARVFELTDGTFSLELHDVLANDEHAVALITVRGERAGKQLADNEVLTYHIRDGKISEVWSHTTDLYAADEFFS